MGALHHLGATNAGGFRRPPAHTPPERTRPAVANVVREKTSGYVGPAGGTGAFHSFLEHTMTISFFILFVFMLYHSLARLAGHGRLWLAVAALPLGLLAGDFVSGLVHWLADTYGSERTPVVGPNFIKWFRIHHVSPQDICAHGFVATNGNTCILAAPLVALCLPFVWDEDASAARTFAALSVALMAATAVATNQFHKWAHAAAPPRVALWLQGARLILHPRHHDRHHSAPFDGHYCIANGWLNPLLERVGFFRALERALGRAGLKAARD